MPEGSIMREWRLKTMAFLLVFLHATAAQAQQEGRWGLGIGFSKMTVGNAPEYIVLPMRLYMPIEKKALRLEPEIGLVRAKYTSLKQKETQIGTGIFAKLPASSDMLIYWGGHLKFLITYRFIKKVSLDVIFEIKDSGIGFIAGPITSVEYFLSQRFSMGDETRHDIYADSSGE